MKNRNNRPPNANSNGPIRFAALQSRLAAGGRLSSTERRVLTGIAGSGPKAERLPSFTRKHSDLALILSHGLGIPISRQLIQHHSKNPAAPRPRLDGRHNVAAWLDYLRSNSRNFEEQDPELAGCRLEHILLQNQKLEVQLAILRRDWVAVSDVVRWSSELTTGIRKILLTIPTQASSIVGLPTADAESRLKDIIDDALRQLHTVGDRMERQTHPSRLRSSASPL